VLLLDFDRVLHPDEVYLQYGRPVLRARSELFMWAPRLESALAKYPEVRIVLSTNWAREFGYARVRKALPTGLQARVIGATWHSGMACLDGRPLERSPWWGAHARRAGTRVTAGDAGTGSAIVSDHEIIGGLDMTMPDERMRAIRWGGELLALMADEPALPQSVRVRAQALRATYPTQDAIERALGDDAPMPPTWAERLISVGRLFVEVRWAREAPEQVRRAALHTLRHFPDEQTIGWMERQTLGHWLAVDRRA